MRYRAVHRAFTLIEMLVSLAIVSTIVTMVYGSYAATSRSVEVYSSRTACTERAQLVLRMMAKQIRCAYASVTQPTTFQSKTQNLRGDLLSFTTTGGSGVGLDRPVGISRVAYRYDERGRVLSICCEPSMNRSDDSWDSGTWRPMLTGVTGVKLEYYDGHNWQTRWNSKPAGRLPQAVKIALSVVENNGREHRYSTMVPIVCRGASQVQQVKKSGRRS